MQVPWVPQSILKGAGCQHLRNGTLHILKIYHCWNGDMACPQALPAPEFCLESLHKAHVKSPRLLMLPLHAGWPKGAEATCASCSALNRKKNFWDIQCLSPSSGKHAKGPLGFGVLLAIEQPLVFPFFFSTTVWLSRYLLELHSIEKRGGKDKGSVRGLFWCWWNKSVGSLMQALRKAGQWQILCLFTMLII